jgi:lipopolysaccharide transport system permease protein
MASETTVQIDSSEPATTGEAWDAIIRPAVGWNLVDLAELWRYRDLLWMLALRDIKVRYKQTLIGAAWAIVQPLATMAVFAVLFGLMSAKATTGAVPYAVSTYAALLVWQLFATSLSRSSASLVENQNMIKKIYCPRIVFPLAPVLAALVDFGVSLALLVPLMAWYGVLPSWSILTLPMFVLIAIVAALAVGLWLAALSAMYRDFMYVVPFLTQFWLFVTPVVYETKSVIPGKWQFLYFLNPMAGVVEGFRWSLFGSTQVPALGLAISTAMVLFVLLTGLAYFRRCENTLADWV